MSLWSASLENLQKDVKNILSGNDSRVTLVYPARTLRCFWHHLVKCLSYPKTNYSRYMRNGKNTWLWERLHVYWTRVRFYGSFNIGQQKISSYVRSQVIPLRIRTAAGKFYRIKQQIQYKEVWRQNVAHISKTLLNYFWKTSTAKKSHLLQCQKFVFQPDCYTIFPFPCPPCFKKINTWANDVK